MYCQQWATGQARQQLPWPGWNIRPQGSAWRSLSFSELLSECQQDVLPALALFQRALKAAADSTNPAVAETQLAGKCGVAACQLMLSIGHSDARDATAFACDAFRSLCHAICMASDFPLSNIGGAVVASMLSLDGENNACQTCVVCILACTLACLHQFSRTHPDACRQDTQSLFELLLSLPTINNGCVALGHPAAAPLYDNSSCSSSSSSPLLASVGPSSFGLVILQATAILEQGLLPCTTAGPGDYAAAAAAGQLRSALESAHTALAEALRRRGVAPPELAAAAGGSGGGGGSGVGRRTGNSCDGGGAVLREASGGDSSARGGSDSARGRGAADEDYGSVSSEGGDADVGAAPAEASGRTGSGGTAQGSPALASNGPASDVAEAPPPPQQQQHRWLLPSRAAEVPPPPPQSAGDGPGAAVAASQAPLPSSPGSLAAAIDQLLLLHKTGAAPTPAPAVVSAPAAKTGNTTTGATSSAPPLHPPQQQQLPCPADAGDTRCARLAPCSSLPVAPATTGHDRPPFPGPGPRVPPVTATTNPSSNPTPIPTATSTNSAAGITTATRPGSLSWIPDPLAVCDANCSAGNSSSSSGGGAGMDRSSRSSDSGIPSSVEAGSGNGVAADAAVAGVVVHPLAGCRTVDKDVTEAGPRLICREPLISVQSLMRASKEPKATDEGDGGACSGGGGGGEPFRVQLPSLRRAVHPSAAPAPSAAKELIRLTTQAPPLPPPASHQQQQHMLVLDTPFRRDSAAAIAAAAAAAARSATGNHHHHHLADSDCHSAARVAVKSAPLTSTLELQRRLRRAAASGDAICDGDGDGGSCGGDVGDSSFDKSFSSRPGSKSLQQLAAAQSRGVSSSLLVAGGSSGAKSRLMAGKGDGGDDTCYSVCRTSAPGSSHWQVAAAAAASAAAAAAAAGVSWSPGSGTKWICSSAATYGSCGGASGAGTKGLRESAATAFLRAAAGLPAGPKSAAAVAALGERALSHVGF
ncbi:hypothetical protein Agub_g11335 [Astrephomene gubernaculifera]|uniref:Uncharacterized protein n=1 Tax=Astrephomene gubernaculifera TaxID=47775 RepID=A0AAD3HQP5_9CHLO|nr:hypothetical protein Agub_g11335 [Astrephomene gubernaculifera]